MDATPSATSARPRRVGLNAHLLSCDNSYRQAGVSRYIQGLLAHLPMADAGLHYVAFSGPGAFDSPGWELRPSRWSTRRPAARILWEQVAQPARARSEGLDLLHSPVYVGPMVSTCPIVVTLHDLSFYLYPELFRPANRCYLQALTRRTVARAAKVIAVSESTRCDAMRILAVPGDKVVAIANGVDKDMRPIDDRELRESFRQRNHLDGPFVLFVGTLEPRKNIPTLLRAHALLAQQQSFKHSLVIAGGKGWYYEEIDALVDQLGLRGKVVFPGYVRQEDLPLWYSLADLFVYPSIYEGFGLPPLEAMACGTPVIVSDVSSLPEVVGEAGERVDPHDATRLADIIQTITQDRGRHAALRQAGLARAKLFSWRATASRTAQVYREVLGHG